jgi:hypothetical protein
MQQLKVWSMQGISVPVGLPASVRIWFLSSCCSLEASSPIVLEHQTMKPRRGHWRLTRPPAQEKGNRKMRKYTLETAGVMKNDNYLVPSSTVAGGPRWST